jgi:hypothetical protein
MPSSSEIDVQIGEQCQHLSDHPMVDLEATNGIPLAIVLY